MKKYKNCGLDNIGCSVRNGLYFDRLFVSIILFTDEAIFMRREIINYKNCDTWTDENLNTTRMHHFQHKFKLNILVWYNRRSPFELLVTVNG